MKKGRWLPGLRALLTIGRELRLMRIALERIATLQDTRLDPTPIPIGDPPEEPLEVAHNTDLDYTRAYEVEQRLGKQLGRAPSAEEICQELDGLEFDPVNPTVVVGRRQPERLH